MDLTQWRFSDLLIVGVRNIGSVIPPSDLEIAFPGLEIAENSSAPEPRRPRAKREVEESLKAFRLVATHLRRQVAPQMGKAEFAELVELADRKPTTGDST